MIVDLDRFVAAGQPLWRELELQLDRFDRDPGASRTVAELERFYLLYERAASDLARLAAFAAPPRVHDYLAALVVRAYTEIHAGRRRRLIWKPWAFIRVEIPRVFRRRAGAFVLALVATLAGGAFGVGAMVVDEEAKAILIPFPHLQGDPAERVRQEEAVGRESGERRAADQRSSFSAMLVTHNTRVALNCLALGMTWGIGTLILLFYNGVVLGAVIADYLRAGQGAFLAGWLLPHGVVEIPAFLIAGQAGLVLAAALIGRADPAPLATRLRRASGDVVTLVVGSALLLAWAALVESFLSQLHAPVLPYGAKIAFGLVELGVLTAWLGLAGRQREAGAP